MRKAVVYSVTAIILGLALMLVLPLPLAEIRNERFDRMLQTMSAESHNHKPLETTLSLYSITDFELLAMCLAIALTAYLVFRHRIFSS
jgi:hypothetical protein